MISSFRGKYFFLSNFYESPVLWEGITYRSAENAFQAAKTLDQKEREKFKDIEPKEAKKLGRTVELRSDWEIVKLNIMLAICRQKFYQNLDLREKLMQTGNTQLIEGNTWGDTYWGVCNGKGQNNLGKILMQIRMEFYGNFVVDQPLLISEHCVAFYRCYTESVWVIWEEPYEGMVYELYKDGQLIKTSVDEKDAKYEKFERPFQFDHDKMTNLYFKSSNHKFSYEDTEVNKFQRYKYKVVAKRRDEKGNVMDVWQSREMEVYTQ